MTMTWKELKEALKGLPKEVMEEVRRLTARERLLARAERVFQLALDYFGGDEKEVPTAMALCALEAGGLYGGGLSRPGAATLRHPAFEELPRHHQPEGPAWDAALMVAGAGRSQAIWSVVDEELGVWVYPLHSDESFFVPLVSVLDDEEALLTAARRAIRAASEVVARGSRPPFELSVGDPREVIVAAARLIARLSASAETAEE